MKKALLLILAAMLMLTACQQRAGVPHTPEEPPKTSEEIQDEEKEPYDVEKAISALTKENYPHATDLSIEKVKEYLSDKSPEFVEEFFTDEQYLNHILREEYWTTTYDEPKAEESQAETPAPQPESPVTPPPVTEQAPQTPVKVEPNTESKPESTKQKCVTVGSYELMQVDSNAIGNKDIKVVVDSEELQADFIRIIESVELCNDGKGQIDSTLDGVAITVMKNDFSDQVCYQFYRGVVESKIIMKIAGEDQWYSCSEADFEVLCNLTIAAYNQHELAANPAKPNIITG